MVRYWYISYPVKEKFPSLSQCNTRRETRGNGIPSSPSSSRKRRTSLNLSRRVCICTCVIHALDFSDNFYPSSNKQDSFHRQWRSSPTGWAFKSSNSPFDDSSKTRQLPSSLSTFDLVDKASVFVSQPSHELAMGRGSLQGAAVLTKPRFFAILAIARANAVELQIMNKRKTKV